MSPSASCIQTYVIASNFHSALEGGVFITILLSSLFLKAQSWVFFHDLGVVED